MRPLKFHVSVKNVKIHSAFEVIEEGKFSASIKFHLEPPARLELPTDLPLNLFGEDLNRALRLEKTGAATVELDPRWQAKRPNRWREEIIDFALERFATVPESVKSQTSDGTV